MTYNLLPCRWGGQHGCSVVLAPPGGGTALPFLRLALQAGAPRAAPLNYTRLFDSTVIPFLLLWHVHYIHWKIPATVERDEEGSENFRPNEAVVQSRFLAVTSFLFGSLRSPLSHLSLFRSSLYLIVYFLTSKVCLLDLSFCDFPWVSSYGMGLNVILSNNSIKQFTDKHMYCIVLRDPIALMTTIKFNS